MGTPCCASGYRIAHGEWRSGSGGDQIRLRLRGGPYSLWELRQGAGARQAAAMPEAGASARRTGLAAWLAASDRTTTDVLRWLLRLPSPDNTIGRGDGGRPIE